MRWYPNFCSCGFTYDIMVNQDGSPTFSNVVSESVCDFHAGVTSEEALVAIEQDFRRSSLVTALINELAQADATLLEQVIVNEAGREIAITDANRDLLRSIYPLDEFPEQSVLKKEYRPTFGRDTDGSFTVTFQDTPKKANFITQAQSRGIALRFL